MSSNSSKSSNYFNKSKFSSFSRNMKKPIIFNPHNDKICINTYPYIQATFIDPGTTSCGFRTVRFNIRDNNIETLLFSVLNFGKTIEEIILGVERELTPLIDNFIYSHYIVIESQPLKRCDVYRTAQHIISFLLIKIANKGVKGVVVEVDPKLKTHWIGGPISKLQNDGISIKEWSKQKAQEILHLRNDTLSLSILSSSLRKGKEDLSDTVCYEYAWWSYYTTRVEIPK